MIDQLLRQLRLVCRLLAQLDAEAGPDAAEPPAKRGKRPSVYGVPRRVTYRVTVTVQPLYPDHREEWASDTLRAKTSRRRVARAVAREVDALLVGYKVGVKVEN